MFELTRDEYNFLKTQTASIETSTSQHIKKFEVRNLHLKQNRGGNRYLPFAFTEHGVTMLASILNSERAITMNIAIVRAFMALRKYALLHSDIASQLLEIKHELSVRIDEHDVQLKSIYDALENLRIRKWISKLKKQNGLNGKE